MTTDVGRSQSYVTDPVLAEDFVPFHLGPKLKSLRNEGPISRLTFPDGRDGWLVTSHDLGRVVFKDPRFSMRPVCPRPFAGELAIPEVRKQTEASGAFAMNPLDVDPPEHTRIRRPLHRHFTAARVEEQAPSIEAAADECIDLLVEQNSPVDLYEAFTYPFFARSRAAFLGIDLEESERILTETLSLASATSVDSAAGALNNLMKHLRAIVERQGEIQADDPDRPVRAGVIPALVASGEYTVDEFASATVMVTLAGLNTSGGMIASSLLTLLDQPEQLKILREKPELIKGAVDELLRYVSLFKTSITRNAVEDVELGGCLVRAGEPIAVSMDAANHDPARFDNPEDLDVERNARGHLAFGYGVHTCLGQHLARLEMRVVLRKLIERVPTLRLVDPVEKVPFEDGDFPLRMVKQLMVVS